MGTEREEFEAFWRICPRKVARADAWKAWLQTRAERPPLAAIIAAMQDYVAWRAKLAARNDFVPALVYPATWLRQERWADEFDASPAAAPAPVQVEPAEQARRERERMIVMRARAAWGDVRHALEHRSVPLGGWPDPRTLVCLETIGGFARICRSHSARELTALGFQFEKAYLDAETAGHSTRSAQQLKLVRGGS